MIPRDYITEWRAQAPWVEDFQPLRLKVEINTREHFAVVGFKEIPFEVKSRWYKGSCPILSYELNELLGTKLRALYQRSKGRDLFDLAIALENDAADPGKIIEMFYTSSDVTVAAFESYGRGPGATKFKVWNFLRKSLHFIRRTFITDYIQLSSGDMVGISPKKAMNPTFKAARPQYLVNQGFVYRICCVFLLPVTHLRDYNAFLEQQANHFRGGIFKFIGNTPPVRNVMRP